MWIIDLWFAGSDHIWFMLSTTHGRLLPHGHKISLYWAPETSEEPLLRKIIVNGKWEHGFAPTAWGSALWFSGGACQKAPFSISLCHRCLQSPCVCWVIRTKTQESSLCSLGLAEPFYIRGFTEKCSPLMSNQFPIFLYFKYMKSPIKYHFLGICFLWLFPAPMIISVSILIGNRWDTQVRIISGRFIYRCEWGVREPQGQRINQGPVSEEWWPPLDPKAGREGAGTWEGNWLEKSHGLQVNVTDSLRRLHKGVSEKYIPWFLPPLYSWTSWRAPQWSISNGNQGACSGGPLGTDPGQRTGWEGGQSCWKGRWKLFLMGLRFESWMFPSGLWIPTR